MKLLFFGNNFHHILENKIYKNKNFRKEILNRKSQLEKANILNNCDNLYIQYILCKYIIKILNKKPDYDVYIGKIKWSESFKIQYLIDFFSVIKQNNICEDLEPRYTNFKKCIRVMKAGNTIFKNKKKKNTSIFSPNKYF